MAVVWDDLILVIHAGNSEVQCLQWGFGQLVVRCESSLLPLLLPKVVGRMGADKGFPFQLSQAHPIPLGKPSPCLFLSLSPLMYESPKISSRE